MFEPPEHVVGDERREDYRALNRPFPKRVYPDERERRPDCAQKRRAYQRPRERAAPARYRRPADDHGRDSLQLKAETCVARDRI